MRDQLFNILDRLIIKNNIRINRNELKLQLSSHPSYPSLHALTGVLGHFNIPNLALRLPVNKSVLDQLPNHFIANIATEKGGDLVLIEKRASKIKLIYDTDKSEMISEKQFLVQWKGIAAVIEKSELIEEVGKNLIADAINWILIILSVLLSGYIVLTFTNPFAQAHFLLSIIGLLLSVQIVKHELGVQSAAANNFCNFSANTSCDAALNSKGAAIFGWFKLSDISLVVFVTYSLFWFLSLISEVGSFNFISAITALAFPLVIYSVYYQYMVVKKWCPLCLGIGSVLILQICSLSLNDFSTLAFALNLKNVMLFGLSLIISSGIWSILKPILKKNEDLGKLEVEYYRFKRDFSLFNTLYSKSSTLSSSAPITGEITLGNQNAPIEIMLVTSPFCYYCKKAHRDIDKILRKAKDKIKVTIRIAVDIKKKESDLYRITSKLIEIYNLQGDTACLDALGEVYEEDVDYQKWLQSHGEKITGNYDSILQKQQEWAKTNGINFTPAFYLNQKAYPKEYDRTDLLYFIDDFIEFQTETDAKLAAS